MNLQVNTSLINIYITNFKDFNRICNQLSQK